MRDSTSRLSDAIYSVSETLEFDTVLQRTVEGARNLADAAFAVFVILDNSGDVTNMLTHGSVPEELRATGGTLKHLMKLQDMDGGQMIPVNGDITVGYAQSIDPTEKQSHPTTTISVTMVSQGGFRGHLYACAKKGVKFTDEDETTLSIFGRHASVAIANAQRHWDLGQTQIDFDSLMSSSPIGIVIFDARTLEVKLVNEETRRIVGGSLGVGPGLDDLLTVLTFRRFDGSEIPVAELPPIQVLTDGSAVFAQEVVIHLPDGRTIPTLVNAKPIYDHNGEISQVCATLQDMTPVEEVERLRTEFLGTISRTLRTPLTAIKGSVATALDPAGSLNAAEAREYFHIIDEQTNQMREIINNLIDLARVEAGTLPMTPVPLEVAYIIEHARRAFSRGGANNSVEVALPPAMPRVLGDEQRISQVLRALMVSAAKYSPEWSSISVSAVQQDVHVAISVEGSGRAVATEKLPHLFRKFYRLDGENGVRDAKEAGYDLAVCKGIVEAHGGRIRADNGALNAGLRFTFTIPVAEEFFDDTFTDGSEAVIEGEGRILVIDPDPQTLRFIRQTVLELGHTPTAIYSPVDVESAIATFDVQLVLMELTTSGADNFELMNRVREFSNAPVILLSWQDGAHLMENAIERGAADFIIKPFSRTELLARIKAVLRRQVGSGASAPPDGYKNEDLIIDYSERTVFLAGKRVRLTPTEYDLLFHLSKSAGRVLTHEELYGKVWGHSHAGDSTLIRSFIRNLRLKIGDQASNPRYIYTESRIGYRMPRVE